MNNPYVVSPRDAARALRAEVWNVSGMMQLPVDPFAMADRLGIAVKQERLDPNLAGFIVREGGGPVEVFLNASDGGMRQRFTLAHELGHFVKNRNEQNIGYVDERSELAASGANPAEVWCNQFAAELLMPAAIIKSTGPRDGRRTNSLRSSMFRAARSISGSRILDCADTAAGRGSDDAGVSSNTKAYVDQRLSAARRLEAESGAAPTGATLQEIRARLSPTKIPPVRCAQLSCGYATPRWRTRNRTLTYADWWLWSIGFVCAQLLAANLFFGWYLWFNRVNPDGKIMIVWLTSSVIEVIGIVVIIATSLFPKGKNGRSACRESSVTATAN